MILICGISAHAYTHEFHAYDPRYFCDRHDYCH